MALWAKALCLSLIPRTHMVGGGEPTLHKLSSDFAHGPWNVHMKTHKHTTKIK